MTGDEERVGLGARGVPLGDVERREVVEVVLDVWTVSDLPAHSDEDLLDLLPQLRDDVHRTCRVRIARQRDVDPLGRQLGAHLLGFEQFLAGGQCGFDGLPRLVGGLADRAALLWRQRTDRGKGGRQAALATRVPHARLFERAQVTRCGNRRKGFGLNGCDVWLVGHRPGRVSIPHGPFGRFAQRLLGRGELDRLAAANELRERDGEHECAAIEELLDEGVDAELLEAGDAGRQEVDGDDRADRR